MLYAVKFAIFKLTEENFVGGNGDKNFAVNYIELAVIHKYISCLPSFSLSKHANLYPFNIIFSDNQNGNINIETKC